MIRHPRERVLQLIAQGGDAVGARVLRHVADCSRCRNALRDYQLIAQAAAERTEHRAPRDVVDRVLALRAAGDRRLLPLTDRGAAGRTSALAVAAAVLIIAGAFVLLRAPTAGAGVSSLSFAPAQPHAGAVIEVTYRPTAELVRESRLWLRARLRTEHGDQYNTRLHQIVLTDLTRQRDGSYRGRFTLPRGVVYAAFAVESEDGEHVDSNHRRLWDLLVYDDQARPLPAAMLQKSNDMMGRDWVRAYAAADSLSRLEPDDPASWTLLLFFQKQVLRGSVLDSVLPTHRARLARFDREYQRRTSITGEELATLMWYAVSLNDTVMAERWRTRLLREAPLNTHALQERIIPLLRKHYEQPDTLLAVLDTLWRDTRGQVEAGPGFQHLYREGLGAALRSRDSAAIAEWTGRYLSWSPRDSAWVASKLAEHAAFRPRAIAMLRSQAARDEPDDRFRSLHRTRAEERRVTARERQFVLSALAHALLASGDTAAAEANYELAADLFWNPEVYDAFATLELTRGDTILAGQMLANVSVDPSTPPAFADSARALLNVDDTLWQRWRAAAAARMQASVMESSTRRLLPRELRVHDLSGRVTTLAALTGGKPAVVVFWSRNCGAALRAAPEIQAMAARLRAAGTPVIIVADEPPSPALAHAIGSAGLTSPVYADGSRQIASGLNVFGTPSYFVLDGSMTIRFEYSTLTDIPRQVAALELAARR